MNFSVKFHFRDFKRPGKVNIQDSRLSRMNSHPVHISVGLRYEMMKRVGSSTEDEQAWNR